MKEESVVKIPLKICIKGQNFENLTLNLISEKSLDWESDFNPYISLMPQYSSFPAFYSNEEMAYFEKYPIFKVKIENQTRLIKDIYENLYPKQLDFASFHQNYMVT